MLLEPSKEWRKDKDLIEKKKSEKIKKIKKNDWLK